MSHNRAIVEGPLRGSKGPPTRTYPIASKACRGRASGLLAIGRGGLLGIGAPRGASWVATGCMGVTKDLTIHTPVAGNESRASTPVP
jgi:hypothetical protein